MQKDLADGWNLLHEPEYIIGFGLTLIVVIHYVDHSLLLIQTNYHSDNM